MRIALLAPLVSPIAPPFLGGAQTMLYDLAQNLNDHGHDVTLYAADGSDVPGVHMVHTGIDSAALASYQVQPQQTAASPARPDDTPIARAFAHVYDLLARNATQHDIVHAHAYDWAAFAYARRQPLPIVHTLHLPALDPLILDVLVSSGARTGRANSSGHGLALLRRDVCAACAHRRGDLQWRGY